MKSRTYLQRVANQHFAGEERKTGAKRPTPAPFIGQSWNEWPTHAPNPSHRTGPQSANKFCGLLKNP
jgi:hypothetical protein